MIHAAEKVFESGFLQLFHHLLATQVKAAGNPNVLLCERGQSFGYTDLVVDFRNLVAMRQVQFLSRATIVFTQCSQGAPVVQDVTHSVQQPGGLGNATGGLREYVPTIARAAVAVGVSGKLFVLTFLVVGGAIAELDMCQDCFSRCTTIRKRRSAMGPTGWLCV